MSQYLVALVGLAVGAGLGLFIMAAASRLASAAPIRSWDARLTIPILLAVAVAHASLIPVVEFMRQAMFAVYFFAVVGVIVIAIIGPGIWRLGALLLPTVSIAGYFYFALKGHEADVVGLIVKAVEVVVILVALKPLLSSDRSLTKRDIAT